LKEDKEERMSEKKEEERRALISMYNCDLSGGAQVL